SRELRELGVQRIAGGVAIRWILGQAGEDDAFGTLRERRVEQSWARGGILHVLPRDLVPVRTLKGQNTSGRLVERDAERVEVRAPVEREAARLLGREVLWRTHH